MTKRPHPPKYRRRSTAAIIFAHPFELALSLVLLLLGARSLVVPIVQGQAELITYTFPVVALVGGALTLAGLSFTWRAPGLEQAGLYLSAAAWGSYMVGLVGQVVQGQAGQIDAARSGLLLSAFLALTLACVIRALALTREERARLAVMVDAVNNGGAHG